MMTKTTETVRFLETNRPKPCLKIHCVEGSKKIKQHNTASQYSEPVRPGSLYWRDFWPGPALCDVRPARSVVFAVFLARPDRISDQPGPVFTISLIKSDFLSEMSTNSLVNSDPARS